MFCQPRSNLVVVQFGAALGSGSGLAEILVKMSGMLITAHAAGMGKNVLAFRFDLVNIVQLPAAWATDFDYLFSHVPSFPQVR